MRRFASANTGSVITAFAISVPVLALFTVCAVQLTFLSMDKGKTKDIADAAAIYGAQQFTSSPSGAAQRTEAFAMQEMTAIQRRSTVTVKATADQSGAVTVQVDTQRDSFFGNMLPVGGFHTSVVSTAIGSNMQPLCVLTSDTSNSANDMHLTSQSKLEAGSCLAQSNHNLVVDSGSSLLASTVMTVGSASGAITPRASTGAKSISDPFSGIPLTAPLLCNVEVTNFGTLPVTLQPGLHCTSISLANGASLTLAPGVHWFKNTIDISNKSTVDGTSGVAMVFMNGARINVSGSLSKKVINLRGAKSGSLAGFVLITSKDYAGTFTLPADAINEITGVVYSPNAKLNIDGTTKTGAASPWTVIVARGLQLSGTADVVINANYKASDVPVPTGVGPSTSIGTRIVH